jgi:hypothetical protein
VIFSYFLPIFLQGLNPYTLISFFDSYVMSHTVMMTQLVLVIMTHILLVTMSHHLLLIMTHIITLYSNQV